MDLNRDKIQFLIVGSSHVRRLRDHIVQNPDMTNFAVGKVQVHFHGISGGKVTRIADVDDINASVAYCQPEHIILHIGGNDLDQAQADEDYCQEIVLKLVLLAQTFIRRYNVQTVTILELLPRSSTRHIDPGRYNIMKRTLNHLLQLELKRKDKIYFHKIRGVKEPSHDMFIDGVHLNNNEGMMRYYRSIRGAIIKAIE